jgi:hypothetical protein
MPQDPIGDLRKKRQREQREKEMDAIKTSPSSKDEAPYKAARERLSKQASDSTPDYRNMSKVRKNATAKDSADYKSGFERASSGRAENFPNRAEKYGQNEAAHRGLRGLSAQSVEHNRKQEYLERPDTPLANTPEPKMR